MQSVAAAANSHSRAALLPMAVFRRKFPMEESRKGQSEWVLRGGPEAAEENRYCLSHRGEISLKKGHVLASISK